MPQQTVQNVLFHYEYTGSPHFSLVRALQTVPMYFEKDGGLIRVPDSAFTTTELLAIAAFAEQLQNS